MIKKADLIKHFVEQNIFPSDDKDQWISYLILNYKYPELTYLSYDGYHCHGIADYTRNLNWQGTTIVYWDRTLRHRESMKIIKTTDKDFCDLSTEKIIEIWMSLIGETEQSKLDWISSLD